MRRGAMHPAAKSSERRCLAAQDTVEVVARELGRLPRGLRSGGMP